MLKITDQYFWNFVFLVFFIAVATMGLIILDTESRFIETPLALSDFVLMTLATWRLVRLFAFDTITRFIREQFWDLKKVGRGFQLVKPKNGPRRTVADLFSCVACLSVWMGATVVFFYLLTPLAYLPVVILAIAAVAQFLQNTGSLVGNASCYLEERLEEKAKGK